jgi:hypothetical protein
MRDKSFVTSKINDQAAPPANYYTNGSQGIVFTDSVTNEYIVRKPKKGSRAPRGGVAGICTGVKWRHHHLFSCKTSLFLKLSNFFREQKIIDKIF